MKILVSGATGFIGRELIRELVRLRHNVIVLSRKAHIEFGIENVFVQSVWWDGIKIDHTKFNTNNIDVIINLSGESIASKRWSKKQKIKIIDSRVKSTKALIDFISKIENKPKLLINASAIGYYGNANDKLIFENFPKGNGFLPDVCEQWENEAKKALKYNVQVAICRFGLVLGENGGVIRKIYPIFKNYFGAVIGSGKQIISWIHLEDLIRAIIFIIDNNISNIINFVSPEPINAEIFYKTFANSLKRPCFFKIPSFVIKLLFGQMSQTLLEGQKVFPKVLLDNNFDFKYKNINSAFSEISKNIH